MKILNLYAGIGGNRKLWEGHEITAIEINKDIANIYKDFFPNDKIIITNAHEYLLNHYKEFDFIWSSPPCPTHSTIRSFAVYGKIYNALYPDMDLYQEIILLQHFAPKTTLWIIENVKPYYNYLIEPTIILHRHSFWCNFHIYDKDFYDKRRHREIKSDSIIYGYNLKRYKIKGKYNKDKILRNMVNPKLGLYILNQALNKPMPNEKTLFD